MLHSREHLIRPSGWVGRSSRRTRRQARSRRAKEAAGWALPTILSSGSLQRTWAAASTCAPLRAMGATISASTPSAFGLTSRRYGRLQPAHFGTDWALGSAGRQQEFVSVDQDCVAYSRTALFGDGRLRTTKPGFVDGAEAVISGCVSVIDRCAVSRAGHPPKRSLWVAQVS